MANFTAFDFRMPSQARLLLEGGVIDSTLLSHNTQPEISTRQRLNGGAWVRGMLSVSQHCIMQGNTF